MSRVGGIVAQNSDFITAVYGSFPLMIALIALLTFVLLARAFRSLLLPLKAVVLNVLSVVAAWGVLTLVWQHGYGSERDLGHRGRRLDPLMAAADRVRVPVRPVDRLRGVHPLPGCARNTTPPAPPTGGRPRDRSHRPTGDQRGADPVPRLRRDGQRAGHPVKMIATGLGAGIILDATIVRALLVPAAVALLGRFNWWLPHPVARVLRVRPSHVPAANPSRA